MLLYACTYNEFLDLLLHMVLWVMPILYCMLIIATSHAVEFRKAFFSFSLSEVGDTGWVLVYYTIDVFHSWFCGNE